MEKLNITPLLVGFLPVTGLKSSNLSLVYEYIPFSQTIDDWLDEGQTLTFNQWLIVLQQVVEIIRLIHSYEVIFNDLHRGNIIVQKRRDGKLKVFIIDFGLATFKQGKIYSNDYGSLEGYNFISPEAKKRQATTKASDVYSVGYIFFKVAQRIEFEKLHQLSLLLRTANPNDRPDMKITVQLLMDLSIEYWFLSFQAPKRGYSPYELNLHMSPFDSSLFDHNFKNKKTCLLEEEKRNVQNLETKRNEYESRHSSTWQSRSSNVKYFDGESDEWKWLTDTTTSVFIRCSTNIPVLDYFEVNINHENETIRHSYSSSTSIYLTTLKSNNNTVIVKQFLQVDFVSIRQEACVTKFLAEKGVAPQVLGILPGSNQAQLLTDASIVQEYFGQGVTLATYLARVRRIENGLDLLEQAANRRFTHSQSDIQEDEDQELKPGGNDSNKDSSCNNFYCSPYSKMDEFKTLLSGRMKRFCGHKSDKLTVFQSVAFSLVKSVMKVHENDLILNNVNEHNIIVKWNSSHSNIDVKLIDLNRVTSKRGTVFESGEKYLSRFTYLAPEVVRGSRSSQRSDVYSLCHVLHVIFRDFISVDNMLVKKSELFPRSSMAYVQSNECETMSSSYPRDCIHTSKTSDSSLLKITRNHSQKFGRPDQVHKDTGNASETCAMDGLSVLLHKCLKGTIESRPSLEELYNLLLKVI